jgi:hypothetical protein
MSSSRECRIHQRVQTVSRGGALKLDGEAGLERRCTVGPHTKKGAVKGCRQMGGRMHRAEHHTGLLHEDLGNTRLRIRYFNVAAP